MAIKKAYAVVLVCEGMIERLLGVFFNEGLARDYVLECEHKGVEAGCEVVCVSSAFGSEVNLDGLI